jgi:hypothetical protein
MMVERPAQKAVAKQVPALREKGVKGWIGGILSRHPAHEPYFPRVAAIVVVERCPRFYAATSPARQ